MFQNQGRPKCVAGVDFEAHPWHCLTMHSTQSLRSTKGRYEKQRFENWLPSEKEWARNNPRAQGLFWLTCRHACMYLYINISFNGSGWRFRHCHSLLSCAKQFNYKQLEYMGYVGIPCKHHMISFIQSSVFPWQNSIELQHCSSAILT